MPGSQAKLLTQRDGLGNLDLISLFGDFRVVNTKFYNTWLVYFMTKSYVWIPQSVNKPENAYRSIYLWSLEWGNEAKLLGYGNPQPQFHLTFLVSKMM